jgi:hypothetical protein
MAFRVNHSVYGPAAWSEEGSWGYRTPIYMLEPIIQLQAVVEIITNETTKALNILAKSTQRSTVKYTNTSWPWTIYLPPRRCMWKI